jgi:hypothetical protein
VLPHACTGVYFNVLYNITHQAMRSKVKAAPTGKGDFSWRWANNVVHDCGIGFETLWEFDLYDNRTSKGELVVNNIFSHSRLAHHVGMFSFDMEGPDLNATHHPAIEHLVWSSNLYWPDGPRLFCAAACVFPGDGPCINCTGACGGKDRRDNSNFSLIFLLLNFSCLCLFVDFAGFRSWHGVGNHSLLADPEFTNAQSPSASMSPAGLRPKPGSPAAGAGESLDEGGRVILHFSTFSI